MSTHYLRGLASLHQEVAAQPLEVTSGHVPEWLAGRLLRVGPGLFDVGEYKLRHLFDGFAMLYKFEFGGGQVYYSNRMLQSVAYKKALRRGNLAYREFATEPQRSPLDFIIGTLFPRYSDNASINITSIAGRTVALNEALVPVEFDPTTLETRGDFVYDDKFSGTTTPAHPQYDTAHHQLISFTTHFSLQSSYNLYRIVKGSRTRQLISTLKTPYPSYMHSFAITENYIILVEPPLVFDDVLNILFKYQQPILKDFDWRPERGTRFSVIRKSDGKLVRTGQAEAFMGWHHINAFEQGNDIFVDICTYERENLVDTLYFDHLLQPHGGHIPTIQVRRFHLRDGVSDVTATLLSPQQYDLPRINYAYNTLPYRYIYGSGPNSTTVNDFSNQIVKTDIERYGADLLWYEEGCYPGEPIFIPRPGSTAEDDGVVVTMVLNGAEGCTFLLIQNAPDFRELARLKLPHAVPFALHGIFYPT